jgi:sterol desaturase/sphingolipid hydroxylase (fatty acid hydroxylase superfamily)
MIEVPDIKGSLALTFLFGLFAWETIQPFFRFSSGKDRLKHGAGNVFMGVINGLMTTLGFVGLWWLTAEWSARHNFGLLHWIALPEIVEWALAVLLLDAWTYLWHRMNHRIPFLWRFHRVHHSDPHMDVTTANRFHVGEILLSSILRVPVILLLGVGIEQIALYELLMFSVVQFHHANIGIGAKWDRRLRTCIVTPFMHKVHHSRWQPETDSNYSSFLSIWDRLFGSYRINNAPESIQMGLDHYDSKEQQSLTGMLKAPWRKTNKTPSPKRP